MTRLEDLTEQEIIRRLPVWTALADFYLDTELRESDFRWIADQIRKAGYTLAEAAMMLKYEVGPACIWNGLTLPGGRWDLWLEEEVRQVVLTRLGKYRLWERIPLWRDLWYRLQTACSKEGWVKVKVYFAKVEPD